MALKFNKSKNKFPKISKENKKGKLDLKHLDKKKLGIISVATVGTVVAVSLILTNLIFKEEVPTSQPNNGVIAQGTVGNSDELSLDDWDSAEEDFNANNFDPLDGSGDSMEVGSLTDEQLVTDNKWYSLNTDDTETDSSRLGSTTTSTYSRIMGDINSSYAKEQQRLQQEKLKEEANKNQVDSVTPTPSNPNQDMVWEFPPPTNNNSNSSNQTNKPNLPSDTDNTKPNELGSSIGKIGVVIGKNNIVDLESFKKEGVTVLEGNNLDLKLFDAMDSLTEKVILDTQNKVTESEVLNWVTNDYSNKLLVTKLNYGFLEESNRYFFLEIDYNVTKQQMKELKTFAEKKVKSLSSQEDSDKIKSIGDIVAGLGNYNKTGKQDIYSPYTFYKNGYGVCQAYTSLSKIMLDTLGIENGIATGVLNSESHSWNVVKIGDTIYHVDFTLYDTQSKSSYLLIKEDDITKDRIVNRVIWN